MTVAAPEALDGDGTDWCAKFDIDNHANGHRSKIPTEAVKLPLKRDLNG